MLLPPGMQPRSPALHRTNPWCLAVVCMIGTLTHVHIGQHRAHLCLLALSQVNEVCCLERRARWSRCSSRPWASRSTSARPPQAPRAIVYVLEAVYGRQHGVCAAPVPSLAWRRRGAAQEQLWGAPQRFAGWRRAWQAYLADLPGWRQSTGPCAAALSVSDNPPHNKICGVVVVRFWSRPWDCRISVNFSFYSKR